MKIALICDTHCGIRNSSDVFLQNEKRFYKDVFFPHLKKHKITQIIHLGDFYDNRKTINIKAIHNNRKNFLNVIRDNKIKMDIILGNHDVYFKNTNKLNSLKEFLGFFTKDVNIVLEPTVKKYGSMNIALLPWINQENEKQSMKFVKTCDAKILMGHLDLNGFEIAKGFMNAHGLDPKLFKRFDKVFSGHFHINSRKGNIEYIGSPFEFYWSDADTQKYFYILDTETGDIDRIKNPNIIFKRIFYDDSKENYAKYDFSQVSEKFVKVIVINKKDSYLFDKFITKIQKQDIHDLKIIENYVGVNGDNISDENISVQDTNELLDTYVDAIETDLDKNRIKSELKELLKRAETLDVF